MKRFVLKFLALFLIFIGFVTCDDDDDDPIVITYQMVIHDRDGGDFYGLNTTTGELTILDNLTYDGQTLTHIRGMIYDIATGMIHISQNEEQDGKILSVDPETSVVSLVADNADEAWYAIQGLEWNSGRLMGTVYWDTYDDIQGIDYWTGLVWLNADGTIHDEVPFVYEGEFYNICCGMSLVYSYNENEVLVTYAENELLRVSLDGTVTEIIELNYIGDFVEEDYIKNLEWGNDGILYAVTKEADLGRINPITGDFTFIAHLEMMGVDDNDWQAMTLLPGFVIEED